LKITCQPGVLGQALQVVSRAISTRTTLPILNNILLETTGEGLALTATNLEIGIRKIVPAEVSMEGATAAPARLLTDFVSTLPDEDLELVLDPSSQSLNVAPQTRFPQTNHSSLAPMASSPMHARPVSSAAATPRLAVRTSALDDPRSDCRVRERLRSTR